MKNTLEFIMNKDSEKKFQVGIHNICVFHNKLKLQILFKATLRLGLEPSLSELFMELCKILKFRNKIQIDFSAINKYLNIFYKHN